MKYRCKNGTLICPGCRLVLHRYANEDVSLGSWLIGLDVNHIDDRSLCCGTPLGKMLVNAPIYRPENFCNTVAVLLILLSLGARGLYWLVVNHAITCVAVHFILVIGRPV